jgi:hypothetical protein
MTSGNLIQYVEPLNDARTPLADFFSILLERGNLIAWSIQYQECGHSNEGVMVSGGQHFEGVAVGE